MVDYTREINNLSGTIPGDGDLRYPKYRCNISNPLCALPANANTDIPEYTCSADSPGCTLPSVVAGAPSGEKPGPAAFNNTKAISSPSEWSLIGGDVSGSTMPTGRIGAYQNIDSTKHLFGGANANASISVSLWFNQTASPNKGSNMLFNTVLIDSSDTTKSVKWGVTNYSNNRIYVTRAGIAYDPNQYVTGVTSNTWHHIVVSYSSINSTTYYEEIYYDGTYMGVQTLNKSHVPYIWDMTGYTNYGFSINSAFHTSYAHSPVGGYGNLNTVPVKVDQFATFNKALSASEISAIYNSGVPTDLTNHDGIVHYFKMGDGANDTGTSIQCQIDSSVTIDSTTDYSLTLTSSDTTYVP